MEIEIKTNKGTLNINLYPLIGGITFFFWQHTVIGAVFIGIVLACLSSKKFN